MHIRVREVGSLNLAPFWRRVEICRCTVLTLGFWWFSCLWESITVSSGEEWYLKRRPDDRDDDDSEVRHHFEHPDCD